MSTIFRGLIMSSVEIFSSNNTYEYENPDFPTKEQVNDSTGLKFKGGTYMSDGWAFQGFYQIENYDNPVYDSTNDTAGLRLWLDGYRRL